MNARLALSTVLLLVPGVLPAMQTLESALRTNGPTVQAAFEPVRTVLQECSAVVRRGSKEVIFATVLTADGYLLTKASELGDPAGLSVIVGDKSYPDPVLVATDSAWDVALLKISAEGLKPAPLALDPAGPERGTWVVANGATTRSQRRVQVGIISASTREIPPAGGPVLGVSYETKGGKLVVTESVEGSGAAAAGIAAGDVLVSLADETITGSESLGEIVGKHRVGEWIPLTVERDGKSIVLEVELKGRAEVFGEELTRNDAMSGRFSERRSGFPRVIQHDVIADRNRVGGPVLDLDGRCLGMNIARANRSETFAIPAPELKALAERLIPAGGGLRLKIED